MIFCKHDWKIIIDEYRDPLTKHMKGGEEYPIHMFQGTRIIILQCGKCGKLDKTIKEC